MGQVRREREKDREREGVQRNGKRKRNKEIKGGKE